MEIEATIGSLRAIKTKVGLTEEQVHEFDNLLKDYAIKYDVACQDYNNKRMSLPEFTCRRRNMDSTLDKIRRFVEAVNAAKNLGETSTQSTIILEALKDLRAGDQSAYSAGCTSTMIVDPKKLIYAGRTARNYVEVTNSGNNDFTFAVDSIPEAFIAEPKSAQLPIGKTMSVTICRLAYPEPPKEPITIHMRNNLLEDVPIQLEVDAQNAAVYDDWAKQVRRVAAAEHHQPRVADAAHIVAKASGSPFGQPRQDDGLDYLMAAGVLARAGSNSQAIDALKTATTKTPTLANEPYTYLFWGILKDREGLSDAATADFTHAMRLASPGTDIYATSSLLTCVSKYKLDPKACYSQPEVRDRFLRDPGWAESWTGVWDSKMIPQSQVRDENRREQ